MHPFAFIGTPDGPVRYAQAGHGDDVVLIHGAMTTVEDMVLGPFERLARRHQVTAFDRPGHGLTRRSRLAGAPRIQADRLRHAMRALDLGPAVIVGQSFGAALAMDLVQTAPEAVQGVVAVSPIVFPEWRTEHLLYGPRAMPGLGDLLAYGPGRVMDAALLPILWHGMFAPQAMPEEYARRYPFALASGASQMLALGEEAMQSLADLAISARAYPNCPRPVTVLSGLADWLSPPWTHASRLAAAAPDSKLVLLPGQGHMLHHFAHEALDAAIEALSRPSRR